MLLGIRSMEKYQNLTKDLLVCEMFNRFILTSTSCIIKVVEFGFSVVLNENGGDIEITICLDFDEILNTWITFIHKKVLLLKHSPLILYKNLI